jgi:hypothetical protein
VAIGFLLIDLCSGKFPAYLWRCQLQIATGQSGKRINWKPDVPFGFLLPSWRI